MSRCIILLSEVGRGRDLCLVKIKIAVNELQKIKKNTQDKRLAYGINMSHIYINVTYEYISYIQ